MSHPSSPLVPLVSDVSVGGGDRIQQHVTQGAGVEGVGAAA